MIRRSSMARAGLLAVVILATSGSAFAATKPPEDAKHCAGKDQTLFTRFPGYFLINCDLRQFDRRVFATFDAKKKRVDVAAEGKYAYYIYGYKGGGTPPSKLQVQRNFMDASRAAGGEVLFEDTYGLTTFRFRKDGRETWASINFGGGGLNLYIVEVETMKQELKANAEAMKGGLEANGHVELVGIFFDTGKSDLKPESDPSLDEAKRLLDTSPTLSLWVVGHTDSVGGVAANLALSQARAAAVVKALVEKRGVDAKRLESFGAGPYAPVATNATEDGRSRNRRVELVAR